MFPLDQLLQGLRLPGVPYEFMSKQFLCRRSPIRVLDQTLSDKILYGVAEIIPFKSRSGCLRNQEQDFHRMRARIRWLPVEHLHCRDTKRPDVCLEVISSLLDNLRRHPERRPDECVPLRFDISELCGDSEIRQFDLSGMREENICRLDIPVNLSFVVQVIQT